MPNTDYLQPNRLRATVWQQRKIAAMVAAVIVLIFTLIEPNGW